MQIACDKFNYELLQHTGLKLTIIDNFGVCDDVFDVVISTWKQINSYIRHNESKIQSSLFVVSQYSDASHNRRISGMIDQFNKMYNTNNKLIVIGDGIADWPCHINSPWSRFLFTNSDYLDPNKQGTHWTCLMSRKATHRTQIEKFFYKHLDLFDNPNDFVFDGSSNPFLEKFMFREKVPIQYKHKQKHKMDPRWQTVKNVSWTDGDLIAPYHRSRIELVAETLTDFFFVTEKTVKPIRAGIPFIVVGSQYFLKRLHKMGFKTFSPWIDESYDKEIDQNKRVQMCCDAFKKFLLDWPCNPQDMQKICHHNQQRLRKIQQQELNWLHRQARKITQQIRQYDKTQLHHTNKYTDGS